MKGGEKYMFDDMIRNATDALNGIDEALGQAQTTLDAQITALKADHANKVSELKDQRKKLTKALSALKGQQSQVVQD